MKYVNRTRNRPGYHRWLGMKARCYNVNNPAYPNYGGRGIKVCDEWIDSFDTYIKDMGPRPSTEHTVDRIDNDGNYEPSNCRWATKKEQVRNRGDNTLITHDGKTLSVTQWAEYLDLSRQTIFTRLDKGWEVDMVLSVDKNVTKSTEVGTYDIASSKLMIYSSIRHMCKELGLSHTAVNLRFKKKQYREYRGYFIIPHTNEGRDALKLSNKDKIH